MTGTQPPNPTPDDFVRYGLPWPLCLPLPLPCGPDPAALRVEGTREPGRSWAVAAAALAAGEPGRALAALETPASTDIPPATAAVTAVLRDAARALQRYHRPGGWSGSPVDFMDFAQWLSQGGESLTAASAGAPRLLTFLAGSLLPDLVSVQYSLGQEMDVDIMRRRMLLLAETDPKVQELIGNLPSPADRSDDRTTLVQAAERTLLGRFTASDASHPLFASVRAVLLLVLADLWHRADDHDRAAERRRAALDAAPADDVAFHGWATLVSGDWALGLPGGAEQRRPAEDLPPPADLESADRLWTDAADLYRRAHCNRGEAAALLRRAHVARLRGHSASRSEFLREAEVLAGRGGDGALHSLVQVHGWLDQIEDGCDAPDFLCAPVREWGVTVGGTSWVQHLSALLSAQATRWSSEGDAPRAAQAEHLAAVLLGESAARAARHGAEGAKHRLSSVVLAEEELTRREAVLAAAQEPYEAEWLDAMQAGMRFTQTAYDMADPDLLTLAAARHERLLEASPRRDRPPAESPADDEAERSSFHADPLGSPDSIRAYAAYCRARIAALAGMEEHTRTSAEDALKRARRCQDFRTVISSLVLLCRMDEARILVDRLDKSTLLSALELTRIRLVLGQAQEADSAAPRLDGWAHVFQSRPWELPGLRAEVKMANGDHRFALQLAEEAISDYEAHRTRLARDTLRSSLADDPAVMSLYHTALLSHLELDGVTRDCADAREGGPGARAGFALAERVRSGFLDSVRALDTARGTGEERAVRAWLRADSRWSAVYEDEVALLRERASASPDDAAPPACAASPDSAERREHAERELAEAERGVRQAVPAALTAWRGTQRITVEAVAAALPPDVLLLHYHLFDDDLVALAITRDRLRVARTGRRAFAAEGLARRFHSWCSGLGRDPGSGADLAELLLMPFARELRDHQQVLLAPPPRMFLLPFQALPWEGGMLGDGRTLSHLPAASVLTRRSVRPTPSAAWSALMVGDPATDPAAGLAPIPGTAVEVRHSAALLPGACELTGAQADLEAVSRAATGRGIVHLAAHGMVDELSPNRNHLVLAGRDRLNVADLYGLHTDAGPQLLVLSGCHTGHGTATSGGECLGLARSAVMAGARHAVVSLWPVDDRSGCLTMIRMYRHLAAARDRLPDGPGPGVATALAKAQQEVRALTAAQRDAEYTTLAAEAGCPMPSSAARGTVRDSGPGPAPQRSPEHPFHWAPFIHIGTQEAMA